MKSKQLGESLVREALQAQGGAMKAKFKAVRIRLQGTDYCTLGVNDPSYTREIVQSGPDRCWSETRYAEGNHVSVLVQRGAQEWGRADDQPAELNAELKPF